MPEALKLALAAAGFASILFVVFGVLLGAPGDVIASSFIGDAAKGFHPARLFAVAEMRSGNLPLWDPHRFSGVPYLGAFQVALLYPPNAHYLVLPIATAINLEFALHLLLLAVFGFAWLRGRGLHPLAAFYSAAVLMLAAPIFHRVLSGQLSVLDVLAWTPLLLLVVDRTLEGPTLGSTLAGIAAVSMMILAGHPPTVYMTAVAAALYAAPRFWGAEQRGRTLAAFAAIAALPLLLTAAQLWTGLAVASEGVRVGGLPYEKAIAGSLPPAQLFSLLAPHLFGGVYHFSGSTFYWDATVFVGVATLVLAVHGAIAGTHPLRRAAASLALLFLLLALGKHAFLYAVPYHVLPGFDFVRAPSKFMYAALFFTALLAAIGLDRLLSDASGARRTAWVAAALAVLALAGSTWLRLRGAPGAPGAVFALSWFSSAWPELAQSAAVAALTAVLLLVAQRGRAWVAVLVAVGLLELLAFARSDFETTALDGITGVSPALREAYANDREDRVIYLHQARNTALVTGSHDVWGYDSVQLQRYAEFIAYTQGRKDALAMDNIAAWPPQNPHAMLRMLRVGRVVYGKLRSPELSRITSPLPRFTLIRDFRVIEDGGAILAALDAPDFDPHQTVVLEEPPVPTPDPSGRGGVIRVLGESTDHVDLEISLDSAAVLLMTDAHARGWRAVALPASEQSHYTLLRADYTLRALPLAGGHHRLRVEYWPVAFAVGRWVSAVSVAGFLAATGYWGWRRRSGVSARAAGGKSGTRSTVEQDRKLE